MSPIPEYKPRDGFSGLVKVLNALIRAVNAVCCNLTVTTNSADGSSGLMVSHSNAVLKLPPSKSDGSGSSGSGNPYSDLSLITLKACVKNDDGSTSTMTLQVLGKVVS